MVDSEAKLIARADEEVIGPLSDLADAMISVDAFCALLSDLRAHDLPNAEKSHGVAIHMVRAGLLRAAIGTVMACLDTGDPRRSNRVSVGQILGTLNDPTLANLFATVRQGSTTALQQARRSYKDLQKRGSYKCVKWLRDKEVGHMLNTPAPEVEYEAIYELRDGAGQIITDLYAACGRPTRPSFVTTALRRSNMQRFSGIPIFGGWDCLEQYIVSVGSRTSDRVKASFGIKRRGLQHQRCRASRRMEQCWRSDHSHRMDG